MFRIADHIWRRSLTPSGIASLVLVSGYYSMILIPSQWLDRWMKRYCVAIPLTVACLLFLLPCYASNVHCEVDIAFGGGRFRTADVVVSNDGRDALNYLGVSIGRNGIIRAASIICEAEDSYFLVPPLTMDHHVKSLRVPKTMTTALMYQRGLY